MSEPPIRNPKARLELWLVFLVTCAVGWSYLRDARRVEGTLTSTKPPGYYGLLTQALADGQLSLEMEPDPLLLRLENPYAGPQGARRPQDMSFFRGKFYLYFGVTPAVILMVPWKVITGTYLLEVTATAFFCFGGFVLAEVWLVGVKRRLFPGLSPAWTVLALLVMGFGSPAFRLSNNSTFYAVPIAAAFFCLMAAVVLVDRALRAAKPFPSNAWLAGASLALGLAVGARPNYVVCVGLLLLPAGWLWLRAPRERRPRGPALGIWAACVLPAAAVGAGLALYNYLRFGDPAEFGIHYTLSGFDQRAMRLMGTDEFAGNLRMYLMLPANTMRYYPFFFSNGLPVGVLPRLTLIAGAVLFPFTLRRPGLRRDPVWAVGGLFLLGAAVLNLAVLCLALFPGVDRYVVDFAPAGLLLGCAVLFAALDAAAAWPAPGRVACRVALLSVALWTLGNGACFGLANRVPTAFRAGLEAASDTLVYRIERLVGSVQGPLELKVVFPQDPGARRDPIVTTGNLAGTGDIVYALYPDSAHVQFGYFHMGAGGPLGVPIAADLETPHTIRVDLGSLYPPRRHPMFDTWSDAQVARLRRRLKVTLDGQTALEASVDVYPSEPGGVRVGENSIAPDVSAGRFGGRILEQRRLGLAAPAPGAAYPGGPVRLTLRWAQILDANEPLVSTGRNGAGDLLNVQVLDGGRVRFQHDSWDSPDVITEPISTDMDAEHVVEIEMGSLYPEGMPGVSAAERCRFALWVDGQPVIDMDRPFHPSTADEVEFGFNAIGGGSSTSMFTGTILGRACVPERPMAPAPDVWGPIELTALFRNDALGVNEPLLTVGMGESVRIIYVRYEDPGHVRFGVDRGGRGGEVSPPVPLDFARPHRVYLAIGALYPPGNSGEWASRASSSAAKLHGILEVRLDGTVVLRADQPVSTVPARQVAIGRNDVNTRTCLRVFSGRIEDVRRLDW
jgi:hypothetical protein